MNRYEVYSTQDYEFGRGSYAPSKSKANCMYELNRYEVYSTQDYEFGRGSYAMRYTVHRITNLAGVVMRLPRAKQTACMN